MKIKRCPKCGSCHAKKWAMSFQSFLNLPAEAEFAETGLGIGNPVLYSLPHVPKAHKLPLVPNALFGNVSLEIENFFKT